MTLPTYPEDVLRRTAVAIIAAQTAAPEDRALQAYLHMARARCERLIRHLEHKATTYGNTRTPNILRLHKEGYTSGVIAHMANCSTPNVSQTLRRYHLTPNKKQRTPEDMRRLAAAKERRQARTQPLQVTPPQETETET